MPYEIAGIPGEGCVLIVVDHASNKVPPDVNLGIAPGFLTDHIAYDIGVEEIAKQMSANAGYLAILGGYSRLVVDLNRYSDEQAILPKRSDGVEIPGNQVDLVERQKRLDLYYHPYHDRLERLIVDLQPCLVLSLHSFTQTLRTNVKVSRPWETGVMYNEYTVAPRFAIGFLEQEGLVVGDQKPYSGKELNATMNRHCEANGQAYTGIEIRQDLVAHETGQRRFADILTRMCTKITSALA